MKAKDLALAILQSDGGGDEIFIRVDIDGQSVCLSPDNIQRINDGACVGLLVMTVNRVKVEIDLVVI